MKKIRAMFLGKISGNERLIIFLAVAVVAIGVTGFAMTIDNFTDYKPPTSLTVQWADYYIDAQHTKTTSDNEATEWTRYTVDYPYRAVFYGGSTHASSMQGHDSNLFVVYSKIPTTDLFTFSYRSGTKATNQTGYIRAFVPRIEVGFGKDIMIVRQSWNGIRSDYEEFGYISNFAQYDTAYNSILIDGAYQSYFDFDFFYECAVEHGKNSQAFDISGLSAVDVPYSYILECENHGTSGGSSSGGNNGGSGGNGGSSSGSSGSGGSGGSGYDDDDYDPSGNGGSGSGGNYYPGGKNTKGSKGRHAWGGGQYGGGIDAGTLTPSEYDRYYDGRIPEDFEVPDYWQDDFDGGTKSGKYSWEKDENIPDISFGLPSHSYDIEGEGSTGQTGASWSFPSFPRPEIPFSITIPTVPTAGKLSSISFPSILAFSDRYPPKFPLN